ncbi:hypothetical protein [Acidovorax sp.]|uniref:hypothetical protein n=1 Tax=Acidovorax sp. TaxID=1872122 RepID=UPI0025C03ADE|nr:hypothetical protein [Acidovorax sp.]
MTTEDIAVDTAAASQNADIIPAAPARQRQPKATAAPQSRPAPPQQSSMLVRDDSRRKAFEMVFGRDYLHDFSDPIIFRNVEMYSIAVRQSYKRDFALISRTMYSEYVYRRRPVFDQTKLDRFSELVSTKLKQICELLSRDHARIVKLCHDNGQEIDAGYLDCEQRTVPIIHGSANSYLQALLLLDQLLQASGSAVLNGVITADQRRQVEVRARRAIYAFSTTMRQESGRLRKAATALLENKNDAQAAQADTMLAQAHAEYDAQQPPGDAAAAAGGELQGILAESRALAQEAAATS